MWRLSVTHLSRRTPALVLLVLVCGCGSRSPSTHVVSVGGQIGTLHVDRSDRAAVVAFAGKPAAERSGRLLNSPSYLALGYGCMRTRSFRVPLVPGRGPSCRTAFFLARKTGRLEMFFTSAPEYSESHGVRIGMSEAAAERLLHRRLVVGCTTALYLTSGSASLSISFAGGKERGRSVKGAHVDAFVVHGHGPDPEIFDCL
jgi:hypothetical protein